jgi:hypothetical protein
MAEDPEFAVIPRIGSVSIATADASYTAPSSVGTALTAGAAGTRISEVVVKCAATSAAAIVRAFLHDGSAYWFFDEYTIAAATGSATVQQTRVSTAYTNLVLPAGWSMRFTTSVSQATHVTVLGGDL